MPVLNFDYGKVLILVEIDPNDTQDNMSHCYTHVSVKEHEKLSRTDVIWVSPRRGWGMHFASPCLNFFSRQKRWFIQKFPVQWGLMCLSWLTQHSKGHFMCHHIPCQRDVWWSWVACAWGPQRRVWVLRTHYFAFCPTFLHDSNMSSPDCCSKTIPQLCPSIGGIVHDVSTSVDDAMIFRKFDMSVCRMGVASLHQSLCTRCGWWNCD